jgi:hypothetical protein
MKELIITTHCKTIDSSAPKLSHLKKLGEIVYGERGIE